jgi:hypothetical protein
VAFVAYGQYGYPDYPDGALRTTAIGLAAHLRAFMAFGELDGVRILAEDTVREMRRAQFPDVAHGQGLIWYRFALRGMPLMGHNGGDSGVATQMYFRPRDDVGVIVLANGNWYYDGRGWPLQRIAARLFEEADRRFRQSISPIAIRFRRSMTRSIRSGSRSVRRASCDSRKPRIAHASTARLKPEGSTFVVLAAR